MNAPAQRKCETAGCDHEEVVPEHLPACKALAQSDGAPPAWRWACPCGWTRYQPAGPPPSPSR